MYKVLVLAPSAAGKSTLVRYIREHTSLHVMETDEEVLRMHGGVWPSNERYDISVVDALRNALGQAPVIYFGKDLPPSDVQMAQAAGFEVVLLDVSLAELRRRNQQRMKIERYPSVARWLPGQKRALRTIQQRGYIDVVVPGEQAVESIAAEIIALATR